MVYRYSKYRVFKRIFWQYSGKLDEISWYQIDCHWCRHLTGLGTLWFVESIRPFLYCLYRTLNRPVATWKAPFYSRIGPTVPAHMAATTPCSYINSVGNLFIYLLKTMSGISQHCPVFHSLFSLTRTLEPRTTGNTCGCSTPEQEHSYLIVFFCSLIFYFHLVM